MAAYANYVKLSDKFEKIKKAENGFILEELPRL